MGKVPTQRELELAFDRRFPKDVREKLKKGRVAVAGLGGLGSNIATMLARCGIGDMLLVDFDTVDVTNLNRQAYGISHIDMKKTDAIREIIYDINPYLDIKTQDVRVDEKNAARIFESYPIVCEAFDNPDNKAMLINTLLCNCPHTIIVSGNGMAGYGDADKIVTRRRLGRLYVCGDSRTQPEEGFGLMAPRVAVCAGKQANVVIRILLNDI